MSTTYEPPKGTSTSKENDVHRLAVNGGMTPGEVMEHIRTNNIRLVDLRFTDMFGQWQHFTIPVSKLEESVFEDGLGFDGSSIRGWQAINESDMLVVPQPETASLDPFTTLTTLGYGDIVPRSYPARMLSILEALIGQIYLVVVVARLVGSAMGKRSRTE